MTPVQARSGPQRAGGPPGQGVPPDNRSIALYNGPVDHKGTGASPSTRGGSSPARGESKDLAIALARALSVPEQDAMLIDDGNLRVGYAPIEAAVDSGRAFAVRVSYDGYFHALPLDFDGKALGVERAGQDAKSAAAMLGEFGVTTVTCQSGPLGFHVLACFAGRVPASRMKRFAALTATRWPTLDTSVLRNRSHARIRPPLAPHRDGLHHAKPLCAPEEALRVLSECRADRSDFEELLVFLDAPAEYELLPGSTHFGSAALARELADVRRLGTGSSARAALFGSIARMGELIAGEQLDERIARERLLDAMVAVGYFGYDADRLLDEALKEGNKRPRRPRDSRLVANSDAARWSETLLSIDWGRRGETGKPVARAVAEMMVTAAGTFVPDRNLAVRDVANAAMVGRSAASARIRDLVELGYLRHGQSAWGWVLDRNGLLTQPAASYSATLPADAASPKRTTDHRRSIRSTRALGRLDGLAGALSDLPQTAAALARSAGLRPAMVSRHLERWERLGLVVHDPDECWRLASGISVESIAATLAEVSLLDERVADRKVRHAAERIEHAFKLTTDEKVERHRQLRATRAADVEHMTGPVARSDAPDPLAAALTSEDASFVEAGKGIAKELGIPLLETRREAGNASTGEAGRTDTPNRGHKEVRGAAS